LFQLFEGGLVAGGRGGIGKVDRGQTGKSFNQGGLHSSHRRLVSQYNSVTTSIDHLETGKPSSFDGEHGVRVGDSRPGDYGPQFGAFPAFVGGLGVH